VIRRQIEIVGVAAIVVGGYILLSSSSGFIADLWDDFVGPFLIMYWIGLGFTTAWDVIKQETRGSHPLMLAAIGVVGGLVVLGTFGGPKALLEDPWLFGAAIAPAMELLSPWWHQRHQRQTRPDPETPEP
jgi:hypothetical protein